MGYGKYQEDFAQWLAQRYLEKKSLHQPLYYSLLDFMEETIMAHDEWDDSYHCTDLEHVSDRIDREEKIKFIKSFCDGREREILELYLDYNMTFLEIGRCMDLTESRICQIFADIVARVKRKIPRDTN